MSTLVVLAGLVCGGMTIYIGAMAAVLRRRIKCPACDHPTLRMVSMQRSAVWPASGAPPIDHSFYRCDACQAEFGREGKGAFVPKAIWAQGGRGDIPRATIVTPKDRS